MSSLSGYVEKIVYRNSDNGYTVLTVADKSDETTCVGTFQYIGEGEYIEMEGEYMTHPSYGDQFAIKSYAIKEPEDEKAIIRYLGSGAIKGVGAALADRIVRHFKEDTFRVIEEEPERLAEVKGISKRMALEIADQLEEKKDMRKAMIFLQQYGISMNLSVKIYKQYGQDIYVMIKKNPYKLTEREEDMMNKLYSAFVKCEKLQKHMQLMLKKGGMYKVYNGNLLFHGCVPMNSDGSFKAVNVNGKDYRGKELYDAYEACVRKVLVSNNKKEKSVGGDILWYLWSGSGSPLFGRDRMTTFERYFVEDKTSHHEEKNAYYDLIETEDATNRIFEEFGLDGTGHIINGHVPVHQSEGENPLKCDGKVIMIDGGFSKPYHKVTGIAGYTLTYNSYGLTLTAHEPFESAEQVIQNGKDIVSNQVAVQHAFNRILVGDTDNGKKLKENIADLKELIEAYRQGIISEREK